jgi:hypothetical protein
MDVLLVNVDMKRQVYLTGGFNEISLYISTSESIICSCSAQFMHHCNNELLNELQYALTVSKLMEEGDYFIKL